MYKRLKDVTKKTPSQNNSLSRDSSDIKKSFNETFRKHQKNKLFEENARLRETLTKIKPVMDRKEWEKFEQLNLKFWNLASKFNEHGENKEDVGL